MKILQFICHLDVGGAETLVKELSLSMAGKDGQRHQLTVLLLDPPRQAAHAEAARETLQQHGVEVLSLNRKPGTAPLAAVLSLVRLLRKERFDVVHSHLPFPDLVTTLALPFAGRRIRHISTIHNSNLSADTRLWHSTTRFRQSVFCSHAAAAANPGLSRRTSTIVNGSASSLAQSRSSDQVDTERRRIRTELGLAPEDCFILSVGRITEQKNQQLLIRSVAALRPLVSRRLACFMVGSIDAGPPDIPALARLAGVEDAVHLTGPRSDVRALLAAADVFVSTSLWEGLPLAVLEALFSGIPCVLSPLAEHREIAAGVPGVYFPADMEPLSFADSLQDALRVPLTHAELGFARQPSLEPYTIEACTRAYLNLYQNKAPLGDRT